MFDLVFSVIYYNVENPNDPFFHPLSANFTFRIPPVRWLIIVNTKRKPAGMLN